MKNRTVFVDRNGTTNVDKRFIYRIEDFEFIDTAIKTIRLLNKNNFTVIVVINQSGSYLHVEGVIKWNDI